MVKIILIIIISSFIISCGGLRDAGKVLRGEKVRTTDEFLVKKRNPLVLPPNYEELPKPKSLSNNKEERENDKIKKIIKNSQKEIKIKNRSSSIEDSIIEKIR